MNAKKRRQKDRRRANRLSEQAWQAADDGNFDLAAKIIRRAVDSNPGNPLLWHDLGILLQHLHDEQNAAAALETAIQLAPNFAAAYASLAELRARQGSIDQAVALHREAVRHAPGNEELLDRQRCYEALAVSAQPRKQVQTITAAPEILAQLSDRIERLDWHEIGDALTQLGFTMLPALLTPQECAQLRALFAEDGRFAKTVVMNKPHFGRGVYRYFVAPLPDIVECLRLLMYPHLAVIANYWQQLLGESEVYESTWTGFRERCVAAGQTTPSPLLLRYESGGFNAPHQDLRGDIFFPVQLVIVLSRRAEGELSDRDEFTGGDFLFCDQPARRPADRILVPAGLGDAILFCTRARMVRIGDTYGLQPVQHGLNEVTSGLRYALGIPLHDFA